MKFIIANLKMNLVSPKERDAYLRKFKKETKGKKFKKSHIVLCPSAIHLEQFEKSIKSNFVSMGTQNVFWEDKGSFTGEISPLMVKNYKAKYVILGHSERRGYFFENDEIINLKIVAALRSGLKVVLCIGENGEQKGAGEGEDAVIAQFKGCLKNISAAKMENVIICYEPVWAISSNNPDHMPTSNEILSAKLLIRKLLSEKYGQAVSRKIKIIYGGSVDSKNVWQTCIEPEMDGALVGKESLTPSNFVKIAEAFDNQ